MNINILKSFFTLESLNILRCYISFNNIIHKPKLMLPEFFIVITRFNRTRFNRTRYNRTLILSTAPFLTGDPQLGKIKENIQHR